MNNLGVVAPPLVERQNNYNKRESLNVKKYLTSTERPTKNRSFL